MIVGVPKEHLLHHHVRAAVSTVDVQVRRDRPLPSADMMIRAGERFI